MRFVFVLALSIALSGFLPATASAAPLPVKQPDWVALTPAQKQVLAPLESDWNNFPQNRRKKWIGLADRYPKMNPDEQKRVQERMAEWAKLSPEQRRAASETYKKAATLPPDKQKEKWEQYQNLPEDQKRALAAQAAKSAEKSAKGGAEKKAAPPQPVPVPAANPASAAAPVPTPAPAK